MDPLDRRTVIDAGAGATEGRSRISAMLAVPAVLSSLRFDAPEVLAEVGVDATIFEDANNLIGDDLAGRMLAHCTDRTGCDDFALRVGAEASLAELGLVGALAGSARDVGTALGVLSRYLSLNDGASIFSVSTQGESGRLHYAVYESGIDGSRQIYQMVSAAVFNILRDLCGPAWLPTEVHLPCCKPRDVQPFRDLFRAPIRFDASRFAISFPRSWLDRANPGSDASVHAALSQRAAAIEAVAPAPLPSQVRRVVRKLLLECKGSIEAVAREFSMHRRTLDRHLDASGSSFRALADDVRFEVARQLLRDTRMSVSDIAVSLHYGDASAFTHAFRRWSGRAPSQWREGLRKTHDEAAAR